MVFLIKLLSVNGFLLAGLAVFVALIGAAALIAPLLCRIRARVAVRTANEALQNGVEFGEAVPEIDARSIKICQEIGRVSAKILFFW